MNNLEIAYNHYKDSFTLIKDAEKERSRFFIILCLLIAGLFLFAIEPNSLFQIIKDLSKEYGKTSFNFSITIVQSLLWIVLLFFTMRYFQINSYIERQYEYLHKIENEIDSKIEIDFKREGRSYLDNYPLILNFFYYIYNGIFPLVYLAIVIYKIVYEWFNKYSLQSTILDTVIATIIVIATCLYLMLIHRGAIRKLINRIQTTA
jgi:hypothetical protein